MPKKLPSRERSDFGQRLVKARKWSGKTQEQVCAGCGISQSAYSQLEKEGEGSRFTVQLATFFGVDPTWLATGGGDEPDWSKPPVGPVSHPATTDLQKVASIAAELLARDPMRLAKLLAYAEAQRDELGGGDPSRQRTATKGRAGTPCRGPILREKARRAVLRQCDTESPSAGDVECIHGTWGIFGE